MSQGGATAEAVPSRRISVNAFVALLCLLAFALLVVARWQNHELRRHLDATRARLHRWAHEGVAGLAP